MRTKRSASHATQIRIDLRKLGFGPDRGSSTAPFAPRFRRSQRCGGGGNTVKNPNAAGQAVWVAAWRWGRVDLIAR
jgi:hypothetical protein